MRVYIAGPFFNEEQTDFIKQIENELTVLGVNFYSPRLFGIVKFAKNDKDKMRRIYESNVNNIATCNVMIAVTDGYDAGTMFELGYATALRDITTMHRKYTIITITGLNKKVNVMLKECVDAHLIGLTKIRKLFYDLIKNGKLENSYDKFHEDVE